MSYTLSDAAKATGKSKMTIHRAIKKGTISARRLEDGSYAIDPAELHRVFPPVSSRDSDTDNKPAAVIPTYTDLLQFKLATLTEQLATLEAERARERQAAQDTIADLRRRLDAEAEERRKLTLMLTDQRAKAPRPGFWRRLFKGKP